MSGGFLREFAAFVNDFEDLVDAGGDAAQAQRLAAQTSPRVVTFTWLLIGGIPAWLRDLDSSLEPDAVRQAVWANVLRAVGFTSNQCAAERPDRPIVVYRGASPEGRFGLAWTTNSQLAQYFAGKAGPDARIYAHVAGPEELLLHADSGTGYAEIVIDPAYLTDENVEEVDR